jgi:DNA-binding transcriptional LysR family regulator
MNISLRQLRAFIAVADLGGFTEASRRMHLTQPALSLLVKELESELGLRLLNRTTRKVELSDAGREFYPLAEKVLDDLQSAMRNASDLSLLKRGVVRICAPQVLACSLLAPVIAAYGRLRPGVEVRLVDALVDTMLQPLASGEVDVTLGPSLGANRADPGLQREALFDSPFVLWCRPDHPLTAKKTVPWTQLLQHQIIVSAVDFSNRFLPLLREHLGEEAIDAALEGSFGQTRRVASITTGLGLAEAGLGATIAPRYIAPLARAFGLVVRPLTQPAMSRTVALYTRRHRELSPAAHDFIAFMRSSLAKRGLRAGGAGSGA